MSNDPKTCLGPILVLDIESAPDPYAVALSGRRGPRAEVPTALHLIEDVSILLATEHEDATWSGFAMHSFSRGSHGEESLLQAVDRELSALWNKGGTLVTYNGGHDLTVLMRRAARHLLFDLPGISSAPDQPQCDVMRLRSGVDGERWSKLRDVAAGLGIPTAHQLPERGMPALTRGIAKSQTDVAMTFLVMLYEVATLRRDLQPVYRGWQGLGGHIAAMGPHGEHLAQFRRHILGRPPDA